MLAIDATVLTPAAAVVIALLGGGGLYALLKVRPEAAQISVNAAAGAVTVQSSVIEDLREQLIAQGARIDILERDKQNAMWESAKLRAENEVLVTRVKALEREVENLRSQLLTEERMGKMEDRLTIEEGRNAEIERREDESDIRQDRSEKRADDTEGHA